MALAPGPALAEPHPTHAGIVADQPVNYTPNVLNGHVSAFVQIGDLMIAGGQFTKVEQDDVVYKRNGLFAFSASTGAISETFVPKVNGQIFDLVASPSQTAVVAVGNFTNVNAVPKTSKVAKIFISTGLVDTSFESPRPNDLVRDIAVANDLFYISGDFTKLGSHARRAVAALDATGSDTGAAHFKFEGNNNGGQTKVQSMDINADGTQMVVAGNFATIDDINRGQLAVFDLTPTDSTLNSWSTKRMTPPCGPRFDTYTRDVTIDPAGKYFVIVNTGGPRGYQRSGLLCDSASRWELNGVANQQPTWLNYSGGDTLTAAIADTNVVYIGGHMRWMNNSYGHNNAGAGAVGREGVAALDPANGLPYDWNPGRRRGYGVFGFALTDQGLWVGSDTKGFGGELRQRIAFCKIGTGTDVPPNLTGSLPGDLVRFGRGPAGHGVLSQVFGGQAVGPATAVPTVQDWRNSHGMFVIDQVLYSGWANGRFRAQSFDGTTLGTSRIVDLHGAFGDIPKVRTMFYDRVTHRVYYTLIGSTSLYYRYFTSESELAGSFRYQVTTPSEVAWNAVRGAFIVGDRLFFTQPNGNLRRVDWNHATGMTIGTPVDVLGPTIDGTNFAGPGVAFTD